MNKIRVGRYTVTSKMADNITEQDKENSLRLLMDAIWEQIQIDKKR